MVHAGRAWRGWFPVGGELTSGRPDRKEGIYFGAEHPADHPRVVTGEALHGANLSPSRPAELGRLVDAWLRGDEPSRDRRRSAASPWPSDCHADGSPST